MRKIPTSIKLNGNTYRFIDIYGKFSTSKYGKKLERCIRWKRYNTGNLTNAKWEKLLGPDANNLKHLKLTYDQTREFIARSMFSTKEQEDLLLGAIIHDWAEAVIGDLTFDLKTEAGRNAEYRALKKIAEEIFPEERHKKFLERMQKIIYEVVSDGERKLGKAFNAIERIGYLTTGIRAWRESKKAKGETKNGLLWLANNVLSGQVIKLIEYSEIYPAVFEELKKNASIINSAYASIPENSFYNYPKSEKIKKIKQLNLARQNWEKWILLH